MLGARFFTRPQILGEALLLPSSHPPRSCLAALNAVVKIEGRRVMHPNFQEEQTTKLAESGAFQIFKSQGLSKFRRFHNVQTTKKVLVFSRWVR